MAEVILKTNEVGNYGEGDILCCFNNRRISCEHLQHICNIKTAARNPGGYIRLNTVSRDWFEQTKQYRFERVSATEVKRVNLITLEEEVFDDTPNAKGERMDVRLFIERRKKKEHHYIFGTEGSEIWYGGRSDTSASKLSAVWDAVETKTPKRRNHPKYRFFPLGRLDIRHHLPVRIANLNDERANEMVRPEYEYDQNGDSVWQRVEDGKRDPIVGIGTGENPPDNIQPWERRIVKNRNFNMNWRILAPRDLGVSVNQVLDKNFIVGHEKMDNTDQIMRRRSKDGQPDQAELELRKRSRDNRGKTVPTRRKR